MRLEEFERMVDHVRRNRDGITARCPAHEDRQNSLSVHEKNGKILLKCFAGCETPDIAAALGLEMRDLFVEEDTPPVRRAAPPRPAAPKETPPTGAERLVATYPYQNAKGELLYEVLRFEPKTFRQRHPDGKGGFVWNLDGVTRTLFNLPAVLDAIERDETVFYVEGEKDVESLARVGLVGTTHCGGSGGWRPEYAEPLRDARVVILPDNDKPGMQLAQAVKKELKEAAILQLPGLPSKGDVSDWLATGGTPDALLALADDALALYRPVELEKFLAEPGELDWLIPGFLVRGTISQLTAKPAAGKTTLLVQMSLQLACGDPFLDMAPLKPVRTLYLMAEGARAGFRGRARTACESLGITGSRLKEVPWFIQPERATSKIKLGSEELKSLIAASKADLVVLDTQRYFKQGGDENSADDWLKFFMEPMRSLITEFGCSFLLVHHFRKSGDDVAEDDEKQRGTSAQIGDVDVAMRLEIEKAEAGKRRRGAAPGAPRKTSYRRLVVDKNKYAPEFDLRLDIDFVKGVCKAVDGEAGDL